MKNTAVEEASRPYIRRVRAVRILLILGLASSIALLFFVLLTIGRNPEYSSVRTAALLIAVLVSVFLQYLYTRLSLRNETSFVPLLTDSLEPELFSTVLRQTSGGRRDLLYLRISLRVTACFYCGENADTVSLVTANRQLWDPSQPEFVSYAVQSACEIGDRDTAKRGLEILEQASESQQYARDPSFSLSVDLFRLLALSAYSLFENRPDDALACAMFVLNSEQAGSLQKLYAGGYVCLALEHSGRFDEAQPYREETLKASPAFGIVQKLSGSANNPSRSKE